MRNLFKKLTFSLILVSFFSSCSKEDELGNEEESNQSNLVGKWQQISACTNSSGEANYFDFNYTYGTIGQIDCDNSCAGGGVFTSFSYTATENSVSVTPSSVSDYCGVTPTLASPYTVSYSISGDILTLDGESFKRIGGGSSNTNSSNGNIAFYTKKDNGCTSISITVNGNTTKNLSYFYPDGISDCSQGTIFNLPAGTHNFVATCGNTQWKSSFSISANGCLIYELH